MKREKPFASARAGSCTVAGYISPPHVSRAGNRGFLRAGTAESEVLVVVVSLPSRYSVANLSG